MSEKSKGSGGSVFRMMIWLAVVFIVLALIFLIAFGTSSGEESRGIAIALIYIVMFVVLLFLAMIPANIAGNKGHKYGTYYLFGLFFFLPALIVALVIPDKKEQKASPLGAADEITKYKSLLDRGAITQVEFDAKKKELLGLRTQVPVSHREKDGVLRECWTCPECGRSWYAKDGAMLAKCGNKECNCKVALER